jgi:hypothetical protein
MRRAVRNTGLCNGRLLGITFTGGHLTPTLHRTATVVSRGRRGRIAEESSIPRHVVEVPWANYQNSHEFTLGDFNGDGLSDLALASDNRGVVPVAAGSGFPERDELRVRLAV